LPEDVADDLAKEFWDEFEGVKKWQKKVLQKYEKTLYVETLGGRKRRGALSLNQVINHPIQGTALDIVTEGMNVLSERAEAEDDAELQPVINVHDDLTFYISDETLERKLPVIAHEMCKPRFDYINVPLIIEVSVGHRWHEVQEIAKYRSDKLFGLRNPYAS
jgi:DNA polymerase I-like protein with 3'-5' exonuclease and polymerase domains